MGIKNLWTVLAPFCDRKPLYEIQGRTVAVDLSCWICEAQNIAEYQVQPRMYLRNLYFRTCYLLLMDVNPVFVLEGKAPELKYDTILARNAIQFKGAKPKTSGVKTGKDRSRFHFVLRQCEEMLGYMGLVCIKGNGEAESLCAYLNEDDLVDGCISQDSDCFAYGAKTVYRNFSISTQGTQSASGGSIDIYDIRKADENLNFGRNKIIAMALLVGCDYSDGVYGIGKDSVLKFFETVSNDEVLDRLRSWRNNTNMYETYEKQLNDKNICTSCGHSGKIQNHTKNGCTSCTTAKGCDPSKYKNERLKIKNEVDMRKKAIKDPQFPDETLIKEFLERKDNVSKLDLKWRQPNVIKFVKFANKFLQWDELYSFEKILPILTRWQCRNPESLKNDELNSFLTPDRIKKVRNPKGIPSYEIIWSDARDFFEGLIPEKQIVENKVDLDQFWSTIEPQNLVESAYPDLVEAFKQSKMKPKKRCKRKKNNVDEITEKLQNVSITEPETKKTRKPRIPKKTPVTKNKATRINENNLDDRDSNFKQMAIDKQQSQAKIKTITLDPLVKKAAYMQNKIETLPFSGETDIKSCLNVFKMRENDFIGIDSSTPVKASGETNIALDTDLSNFDDDDGDLELSDIVDEVVSRKAFGCKLKEIAEKYVQNMENSIEIASDDSLDSCECDARKHQYEVEINIKACDDGFERSFKNSDSRNEKTHKRDCQGQNHSDFKFDNRDIEQQKNVCDSEVRDLDFDICNYECEPRNDLRGYECGNDRGRYLETASKNDLEDDDNGDPDNEDVKYESSFLISNLIDENDFFDKTFNATFKQFDAENSNGSDTEPYDFDGNDINDKYIREICNNGDEQGIKKNINAKNNEHIISLSDSDDSFCDNYVPLYERIKK